MYALLKKGDVPVQHGMVSSELASAKDSNMVHPIAPHSTFSVISMHYNLPPNARNTAGAFIGGGATISRRTANYLSESTKDDGTEYIYGTVLR